MTISPPAAASTPVSTEARTAAQESSGRATSRHHLSTAAAVVLATLVAAIAAAAAVFFIGGGRWFLVATPSMGQSAPVGTLVLTLPATVDELEVGDVITFRPQTERSKVYTHRVVSISGTGRVHTRGDINGAEDPWELEATDIIGRAAAVLPGVGWAIRALPLLALGAAGLWLVTARFLPRDDRSAARVIGASFVVSLTAFILRPFVGVAMLATTVKDGAAQATVVSTGLLPIRAQVADGTSVDLVSGAMGTLSAPVSDAGHYPAVTALNLPPAGWLVLGLVCAIPLLWCLIVGLPARTSEREDA